MHLSGNLASFLELEFPGPFDEVTTGNTTAYFFGSL